MKKIILLAILCLCWPLSSHASGPMMVGGGSTAVVDTGWTDAFTDGTGNMTARTGWGTTYVTSSIAGGDQGADWTYGSGVSSRVDGNGQPQFILADYTPTSENYYAEYKVTRNADSGYIVGPIVRGSVGATSAIGYYVYDINAGTSADIHRFNDGAADTNLGACTITNLNWTTPHTIRLAVSGTGATVTLTLYLDGNSECTKTDESAGRIVTTGKGGMVSYWQTGYTVTIDDFAIGY